jgi:conjugal transfer pilus assembly protein TraV
MSGLGESSSSFACKAPEGVTCKSVTGIYSNAAQHNLPAQMAKSKDAAAVVIEDKSVKLNSYYDDKARGDQLALLNPSKSSELTKMPPSLMTTPQSGDPIRSLPLTLRIWLAPWVDADGDLHDQHYVYTTVHNGEWLIEANQAAIKDKYKAVSISKRALGLSKTPTTNSESSIGEALGNANTDGATK